MNTYLCGLLCCFFLHIYAAADDASMEISFDGVPTHVLHRKLVKAVQDSDMHMISEICKQTQDQALFNADDEPILFHCKTRETAELLVSFGVKVSARDRVYKYTVVHHLLSGEFDTNSCVLLRYYLDQGVSPNAFSKSWGKPLGILAVLRIYPASDADLVIAKQMVEILMEKGADPQSKFPQGWAKGKTSAEVIRIRAENEEKYMHEWLASSSAEAIKVHSSAIEKHTKRCMTLRTLADYIEQYKSVEVEE
jgi:hypothetical protein